jgi:hypothetical protein
MANEKNGKDIDLDKLLESEDYRAAHIEISRLDNAAERRMKQWRFYTFLFLSVLFVFGFTAFFGYVFLTTGNPDDKRWSQAALFSIGTAVLGAGGLSLSKPNAD